jgi:hypothetical protein
MNEIVQLVSQVGFPIVVALYSLVRLENTVKQNTMVLKAISVRMGVPENESN